MWMTKIGFQSRRELTTWLAAHCRSRVHVPVWAAHEYVKHHVAGTIVSELGGKIDDVASIVGSVYAYFRPFLDEAYGPGTEGSAMVRAATRDALDALDRLAVSSRRWQKSYARHSSEVIAFINANTPETTSVYGHLEDLPAKGTGRFVGSVPPGFQDRRKKGSGDRVEGDDSAPADSNRFGDLVFWRELLDHAREMEARAIIVLTNDRKNDWHMGGDDSIRIEPALLELRKSWRPVPRPHPMLALEAKLVAGVERLDLLDSPYLAALLRDLAEDEVRAFADVAIVPDGPEPEDEGRRRAKLIEERSKADIIKSDADAAEKGHLFPDAPEVAASRTALMRALLESRHPVNERGSATLDGWRASVDERQPLREALRREELNGWDHKGLVRLARELHDRVLDGVAGYGEVLADLVSVLSELPPNTGACFYLGLLASMYMRRETNLPRLPPASPVAQLLFDRQSAPYATVAVGIVAKRVRDGDVGPVYVPRIDMPPVAVSLDTEQNSPELDELRSLRLDGVELLTPAQADEALRLAALFGVDSPVSGDDILRKACDTKSARLARDVIGGPPGEVGA